MMNTEARHAAIKEPMHFFFHERGVWSPVSPRTSLEPRQQNTTSRSPSNVSPGTRHYNLLAKPNHAQDNTKADRLTCSQPGTSSPLHRHKSPGSRQFHDHYRKRQQTHPYPNLPPPHHSENSQVGIAKVRNAVPARMHILLGGLRRLDDAVLGALNGVVRPPRQKIRRVHDNGVFDRRGIDESAFGREDLQAAGHVLEEKRDGAVVGMRSGAHSPLVLLELACWAGRVVQESAVEERRKSQHRRHGKKNLTDRWASPPPLDSLHSQLTGAYYPPCHNTHQTTPLRSPALPQSPA
jgi:hypothetical protein